MSPAKSATFKTLMCEILEQKTHSDFFCSHGGAAIKMCVKKVRQPNLRKKHALSIGEVYLLLPFKFYRNLSNLAFKITFTCSIIDF